MIAVANKDCVSICMTKAGTGLRAGGTPPARAPIMAQISQFHEVNSLENLVNSFVRAPLPPPRIGNLSPRRIQDLPM